MINVYKELERVCFGGSIPFFSSCDFVQNPVCIQSDQLNNSIF